MDTVRHIDSLALQNLALRIQAGDNDAVELWLKMRGLAALDTSRIGPTESDAIIEKKVERRITEVQVEDQLTGRDGEPDFGSHTVRRQWKRSKLRLLRDLNECTLEEAFNDRFRDMLESMKELDGPGEDDNTRIARYDDDTPLICERRVGLSRDPSSAPSPSPKFPRCDSRDTHGTHCCTR